MIPYRNAPKYGNVKQKDDNEAKNIDMVLSHFSQTSDVGYSCYLKLRNDETVPSLRLHCGVESDFLSQQGDPGRNLRVLLQLLQTAGLGLHVQLHTGNSTARPNNRGVAGVEE